MREIFSLAFFCLIGTVQLIAQPVQDKDSAANKQYIINDSVLIKTRDGAHISALVVRKAGVTAPQPTILVFTIYPRATDINKAKEAADKGYAGIVAYTRGKRYSPDAIVPYEHDGSDAYDVIDWIAQQSWSDKQVGMYGGSYSAFAQWAATKQLHPALKTIVPSASAAPGLDVPMTNNVFMSFPFPWTYYVTNNKWLDSEDYNNRQWGDVYQQWFEQGRTYRALDTLAGRPGNTLFQRWLDHPTYDKYWQNMIPYQQDFAHINIPVLTTTGYYDGGQIGATYYLREHLKYNPKAQHYLLIGPYGHFGSQGYPDSVYNNYPIDPVARIPIHDIIYQWFDHILKGGSKPAMLKDYINYEVMGANLWKHATSLATMNNQTLRLYLKPDNKDSHHILSPQKPSTQQAISQHIDFTDREHTNSYYYANKILYDSVFPNNGLVYKTEPLKEPLAITGRFTGQLIASINKRDMDYSIVLFEQTPDGRYFYLSYYMGRASFARSNTKRQLLTPGKKETILFSNTYMTGRQLSKGSRIVAIVNINKSPFEQINYGTGRDVNTETIKDAGAPLHVQWYNSSYLDIPVWK